VTAIMTICVQGVASEVVEVRCSTLNSNYMTICVQGVASEIVEVRCSTVNSCNYMTVCVQGVASEVVEGRCSTLNSCNYKKECLINTKGLFNKNKNCPCACLIKYYGTKTYGGMHVQIHIFLI
jgi:hypothetical protein